MAKLLKGQTINFTVIDRGPNGQGYEEKPGYTGTISEVDGSKYTATFVNLSRKLENGEMQRLDPQSWKLHDIICV